MQKEIAPNRPNLEGEHFSKRRRTSLIPSDGELGSGEESDSGDGDLSYPNDNRAIHDTGPSHPLPARVAQASTTTAKDIHYTSGLKKSPSPPAIHSEFSNATARELHGKATNEAGRAPATSQDFRESSSWFPSSANPPPTQTLDRQSLLAALEALLADQGRDRTEQAQKKAEEDKFARLESLLIAQQTARIEEDAARKKAAEEAALKAAQAKKKGDEDKLAKLEKLILAQKEEQLKREAADEAARKAEKAEADAKAAKVRRHSNHRTIC